MISFRSALRRALKAVPEMPTVSVAIGDGLGFVLAENVVADRDSPPGNHSSMDGFAVRSSDTRGARRTKPVRLAVMDEIPAGALPRKTIRPGEAARIMTGGLMPKGADCVVPVEETQARKGSVLVARTVRPLENVRRRGEEIRRGARVLPRGRLIGPAEIGILAAFGRRSVLVRRKPIVAVLATGDELVGPAATPGINQIRNSNSPVLHAALRSTGVRSIDLGISRDDPRELRRCFRAGMETDAIVVSGGVSVGAYDFVHRVLKELGGRLLVSKVAIRPGMPFAFGLLGNRPFFGLPGNPVSSLVTFEQFVRPALLKMSGYAAIHRPTIEAVAGRSFKRDSEKFQFVRVRLSNGANGRRVAHPTGPQGSHRLSSLTRAAGLLLIPPGRKEIRAGSRVRVQVLERGVPASRESVV